MKSEGHRANNPDYYFSDGTSQNVMATCSNWQSDNVSVLTINSGGLITAQGSGASTITTTCRVVSDHPVEGDVPRGRQQVSDVDSRAGHVGSSWDADLTSNGVRR